MIKRIIEVSNPYKLSLHLNNLIVSNEKEEIGRVPLEDVAILILDHAYVSYTLQLMQACLKENIIVIFCNEKHLPAAILLPFEAHTTQAEIYQRQFAVKEPTKKQLWQKVIQGKLKAQADVILAYHGNATTIQRMIAQVKSGDTSQREGAAAKYYWKELFGKSFKRDPELDGINAFLNYGYAVIRAAVARCIVGTGLHPSLGIHHHNKYNAFQLADDLMEPLRPLIDRIVKRYELENESFELNQTTKGVLLSVLTDELNYQKKHFPFLVAVQHYVTNAKRFLFQETKTIAIPEHLTRPLIE